MRNILIVVILLGFAAFVIIVIVLEKLKGQQPTSSLPGNRELIDVSDLANSEEFAARDVGIRREKMYGTGHGAGQAGYGNQPGEVGTGGQENRYQSIPRVTGAVFGQGFEVHKADKVFRSGSGAVLSGVRCS